MTAYREIETARPVGLGPAPIPFTAIAEYFKIYELEEFENFEDFHTIIRSMDLVVLELNSSIKKAEEKPKNGGRNPNPKNIRKGRHGRQ